MTQEDSMGLEPNAFCYGVPTKLGLKTDKRHTILVKRLALTACATLGGKPEKMRC